MSWENLNDAFKELDVSKFKPKAADLGDYMKALTAEGFTREEALKLVEGYSKFTHDMAIEQFISEKDIEWEQVLNDDDDDDVDSCET